MYNKTFSTHLLLYYHFSLTIMAFLPIFKQWISYQDGLDNLTLATASLPVPGPSEVLVKIDAVALNFRDIEAVMGFYSTNSPTKANGPDGSLVPCSDMCGTIMSSNSPLWKVGDKVLSVYFQTHLRGQVKAKHMESGLGWPLQGVLAEYRVFPDYGLVRKPRYLSDEEAATLPIAGLTAWMAINWMRQLGRPGGEGEKVLIQGTGGVAISGLQIAKANGAEGKYLIT